MLPSPANASNGPVSALGLPGAARPLRVNLAGIKGLLLTSFTGHEGMSQLFRFELDLLAPKGVEVPFDRVLGGPVTVELALPDRKTRYFNGIVARITQGHRGVEHTAYRAVMVPRLWLLTKNSTCRIFQEKSVPDILFYILKEKNGLDVEGNLPGFHPRNYCVQYRESDFNFVSRLMEEEGIYYYFRDTEKEHKMVLGMPPQSHPPLPGREGPVIFDDSLGGSRTDYRVTKWEKAQELRPGQYVLEDYSFQIPDTVLFSEPILPSVEVGKQGVHPLQLPANDRLQIDDFSGEVVKRFDNVAHGGTDSPTDQIEKIYEDGERTVDIRMQQEAASSLVIRGAGDCRPFVSGHCFTLATKGLSKERSLGIDGQYVLTGVTHAARAPNDRTGGLSFRYSNTFTCIPLRLPYRPSRVTPRPVIPGTQTAVVAGSGAPGEEIFTDRFGRVKVNFPWDSLIAKPANSCWVRVAQVWAGKSWGASYWPRVGQEVVVAFLEGDPDQPIIVGSVYNEAQRPPYLGSTKFPSNDPKHPNNPRLSGIKTCSTPGGGGFNELRFDDTKGKEQVFLHAERSLDVRVGGSHMHNVGGSYHLTVGGISGGENHGDWRMLVNGNEHHQVVGDQIETVDRNHHFSVGGFQKLSVDGDQHISVTGELRSAVDKDAEYLVNGRLTEEITGTHTRRVDGNAHRLVKGDDAQVVQKNKRHLVSEEYVLSARQIIIRATETICLSVGGNFIQINQAGVQIEGKPFVDINCGSSETFESSSPSTDTGIRQGPEFGTYPEGPAGADNAKSGFVSAPQSPRS